MFSSRAVFKRSSEGKRLSWLGDNVYLRHPKHYMLGRFFVPANGEQTVYTLDFMVNERQHEARRVKTRGAFDFDAEDIPALLEAILKAQAGYQKPPLVVKEDVILRQAC